MNPQVLIISFIVTFAVGIEGHLNSSVKQSTHRNGSLLNWKPPEEFHKLFPCYLSGYDYDDIPVVVLEWGTWDFRSIVEKGGQDLVNYDKYIDLGIELFRTGAFRKNKNESKVSGDDQSVVIFDFEGVDLKRIASPAALKHFIHDIAKYGAIYDKFAYGYALFANPIMVHSMLVSKPFIGNFLERIEVYGTISRTWIPQLLKKIPRSQLSPKYGGLKGFTPVRTRLND